MPGYAKVLKSLWIDERFRALREDDRNLLLYLMTSPHANSMGYYRLPNQYICADLQWGPRRLKKAWDLLGKSGLARRCDITEIVFLPENFKVNAPEAINVTKKWKSMLLELPHSPLLVDFIAAARKYLPNGWQTAWLADVEVSHTQSLNLSLNLSLSSDPTQDFAQSHPIPVTRNPKPVTRNPKPQGPPPPTPAPKAPLSEAHGPPKARADPRVKQILDTISTKVGYQIPHYAKEGAAVKRALKMNFSPEQFIACWEMLKTFAFWQGKWLPLAKVTENLGEFVEGRLSDSAGRDQGAPPSRRAPASAEDLAKGW